MKKVVILLMGLAICVSAEFSRSGGVVNDSVTRLEWQDDYGNNGGVIKKASWSQALIYCDELVLDSKSDWRLPSLNELESIVDYSRKNPAISSIFQNVTSNYYWSSTTYISDNSDAWRVYFHGGRNGRVSKTNDLRVRCVRGG